MGAKLRRMIMILGLGSVLLCGCGKEAQQSENVTTETGMSAEIQDTAERDTEDEKKTGSDETEKAPDSIGTGIVTLKDIDYEPEIWLYDEIISDFKLTAVGNTDDTGLVLDFEFTFVDGQTCKGRMRSELKTSIKEMKLEDFRYRLLQPEIAKEEDNNGNITAKVLLMENIQHQKWSSPVGDIKVYDTLAYDSNEGKWDTTGACEIVWNGENGEQSCKIYIEKTDRICLPEFAADYDGDGVADSVYRWRCEYGYDYYIDMSTAGNLMVGTALENYGMMVNIVPADLTGDGRKEILFIDSYNSMCHDISHVSAYIHDGEKYIPFDLPTQKSEHEFTVDRNRTRVQLTCEAA